MIHITKIRIFMFFGALTFLLVGCGAGNNANSSPSPSLSSSITSSSSIASSLPASSSSSSLFSSSALSSSNSSSSLSSSRSSSSSSLSSSASSSSSSVYTVATFAAAAAFNGDGLTIDKAGNIFVGTSKGHTINKITPSGVVTLFATFAGGSANGSDFDSLGNLYVANEAGNIIQKITPDGVVSDYLTNVNGPGGIYIDEQDNLIVGLYGVSTTVPGAEVLKVAPDKTVTSFVSGNGLTNVVGVTGDGKGRYFAANFLTGEIFEITGGTVKQIGSAGTRVNHMKYFDGYIYMPNPFDNVVRRMDLKGNVELIAGTKGVSSSINGPASLATFSRPNSIDISADGKTIYILDFNTGDVRSISMKQ